MPPVEGIQMLQVLLVAVAVCAVLMLVARSSARC